MSTRRNLIVIKGLMKFSQPCLRINNMVQVHKVQVPYMAKQNISADSHHTEEIYCLTFQARLVLTNNFKDCHLKHVLKYKGLDYAGEVNMVESDCICILTWINQLDPTLQISNSSCRRKTSQNTSQRSSLHYLFSIVNHLSLKKSWFTIILNQRKWMP